MKRERGESSGGGIGVLGLLGVAFVVLKLAEIGPVAHWSWWWVTAPFWGGLALLAAIGVVAFLSLRRARGIRGHHIQAEVEP